MKMAKFSEQYLLLFDGFMKHLESNNAPDICLQWLLKYGVGVIGYPCTCIFPFRNSRPSLGKVPKNVKTL